MAECPFPAGSGKGTQVGRLLPAADPPPDRLDELLDRLDERLAAAERGCDHHESGARHVSRCNDVNFQHECLSRRVDGRPHA